MTVLFCALLAAIAWSLLTWWLGLPSSSRHALIGGLCGATLAGRGGTGRCCAGRPDSGPRSSSRCWPRPCSDFSAGIAAHERHHALLQPARAASVVSAIFGKAQLASAGFMGFSHGSNDAQKTMGIITLTLFAATQDGLFERLPPWAVFPQDRRVQGGAPLDRRHVRADDGGRHGGRRHADHPDDGPADWSSCSPSRASPRRRRPRCDHTLASASGSPSPRPTSSRPRSWAWARPSA